MQSVPQLSPCVEEQLCSVVWSIPETHTSEDLTEVEENPIDFQELIGQYFGVAGDSFLPLK